MRTIIFSLLILICASFVSAQSKAAAKINLKRAGLGRVVVSKGTLRATIDLSKNIAGCSYVSREAKREFDKQDCTALPAGFKLLDAQTKNKQYFLLVEAKAMGNCNVCRQCGASESSTLIWLKLNARLRILERKNVPIEDCLSGTSFIAETNKKRADAHEDLGFKFKNGILRVEFETTTYGDSDTIFYQYSILEYNRKMPEKGFNIKTEKRENSTVNGQ